MPRGPGKKENYNLDYSRFNQFDRDEVEEPSKDQDRDEDRGQNEADAAAGAPSQAEFQQMLQGMPPELREAFRLMQIAKANGDTAAQERASELALKAVERGGPEVQNAFMNEVGKQMPEVAGRLTKDMAGFGAGGANTNQLVKTLQDEAVRHAAAKKMAEESEDSELRISDLKQQMEEGQKATRKEMEHLETQQAKLEQIKGPEDFMKFMQEEGITNEDLQRIFSGDEKFMQARLNETLEKKMAKEVEGNGSKDAAEALKKVDELHSTLFGEDNPIEEEKAPEPQPAKAKEPEPPAEPQVQIPMYRLQYQKDEKGKYTVVELKCSLPGVADMSCVNLDVSDKHLRLSTVAPAPRYAVNAGPFPVLIDPNGARAKYSKKREELSISVPCKA